MNKHEFQTDAWPDATSLPICKVEDNEGTICSLPASDEIHNASVKQEKNSADGSIGTLRAAADADGETGLPVNMLLFCPHCGEQHVDEAAPDVCETCGGSLSACSCLSFKPWLNPPHKSHRCTFCNHVWRPADVPTNGVIATQSKGSRDGNPRPRYYKTAADFEAALKATNQLAEGHTAEQVG